MLLPVVIILNHLIHTILISCIGFVIFFFAAIPQFGQQLEEIRVTEGTDVTLSCDPLGFPPPQLTWTPNPSNLDRSRTIVGRKCCYVF